MKRAVLLLVLVVTLAPGVSAHEIRPGYLELRQTGPDTYDALWKVPGQGEDLRLGHLRGAASGLHATSRSRDVRWSTAAFTERWTVKCAGGLTGGTIHIAGLSATVIDVLVRVERLDGSTQVTRLTPSTPSFVVAAPAGALGVARTYTVLGVEHILSGVDHLLFVLALIIITSGGWKLVKTVTAFTVSHSITLTLATLGYVHVPQRPVEAVIALSIVFVASEILHARAGRPGLTARAPWVVALTFGLMHGLGFASGLSDAGLPDGHIPTALLFFSLGVEAGHFLFIGVVLSLVALARRVRVPRAAMGATRSTVCHRQRGDVLGHSAHRGVLNRARASRDDALLAPRRRRPLALARVVVRCRAGSRSQGLRQGSRGFTVAIAGLSFSSGGVLTDPTLPVENVHAEVWTPSVGFARSFSLFGRTAQTLVALPFSSARATGTSRNRLGTSIGQASPTYESVFPCCWPALQQ